VKAERSDDEGNDSSNSASSVAKPKRKIKAKAAVKVKAEPKVKKESPAKPAKKKVKKEAGKEGKEGEEEEEQYKWWKDDNRDETVMWDTLEHSGPVFPPLYIPHGIKMKYDGVEVELGADAEEIAVCCSLMGRLSTLESLVQTMRRIPRLTKTSLMTLKRSARRIRRFYSLLIWL
jgi:DNA topoisomerase-1